MDPIKAPGLKFQKRKNKRVPYWVADEKDVLGGYSPKTVNLEYLADTPDILVAKCNSLQSDMLLWRAGYRRNGTTYDGTIKSLLELYETHPDSSFQTVKPSTRYPYTFYLAKLKGHIGPRRVDAVDGSDIIAWHKVWSSPDEPEGRSKLAAAAMARAVLKAACTFGVLKRLDGAKQLLEILKLSRFEKPASRSQVLTAEQVIAARAAAHDHKAPSRALAYALTFETLLRLWDTIGQWIPINDPGLSEVISPNGKEKWIGLSWHHIDEHMVLRFTPSKTSRTSNVKIVADLKLCPMVMEEIEKIPAEQRVGPVIVAERSKLPYREQRMRRGWSRDKKVAGIPVDVWARDLRASGVTEGRDGGAATDDAAKVAGHTTAKTTAAVYDRGALEAHRRFANARLSNREQGKNGGGNTPGSER